MFSEGNVIAGSMNEYANITNNELIRMLRKINVDTNQINDSDADKPGCVKIHSIPSGLGENLWPPSAKILLRNMG